MKLRLNLVGSSLTELNESLLKNYSSQSYLPGEYLFNAGNLENGLIYIYSGKVKVFKTEDNGIEEIIRIAGKGDFLGYNRLTIDSKYKTNAEALEDTIVINIPKKEFLTLLK